MKFFLKAVLTVGFIVAVAGTSGYLTLRFIIKSEDTVVVPDLLGKDIIYALNMITDVGLNIKVSGFEYQADVPKNHVAYQDPVAGSVVKKDRDVRIVISRGPKSLIVPNLVGVDARHASIIIEESGLSQGAVSRTFSEVGAAGEVISQVPAAGTVAARGDFMDLLVSLGRKPTTFEMPALQGMTLEQAIRTLDGYPLGVGQVRFVQQADLPPDVVMAQNPGYGYKIRSGGVVDLTMNRIENDSLPDKGLTVFHHGVAAGFLKRHITIRVNAYGMLYELYDDFARPGEQIWFVTPPDPGAAVLLYENGELVSSQP